MLPVIEEKDAVEPYRNRAQTDNTPYRLAFQLFVQHLMERLLIGVQLRHSGIIAAVDVQIRCQVADVFPAQFFVISDALFLTIGAGILLHIDAVAHRTGLALFKAHGQAGANVCQEQALLRLVVQPALNGVDLI